MNYKTILSRKAQRPSKQTNEELAIKIIRAANKIKYKYKTNYYYVIAKMFSIRVERVQLCLKRATAGGKNIFNKKQPWKTYTKYYYDIKTWRNNINKAKIKRNKINIEKSLSKAKSVSDFIKNFFEKPLKLKLANGKTFFKYQRRSVKDYLHQYEIHQKQVSPVGKSTIYRFIKHKRPGYPKYYFIGLFKKPLVTRAKINFPKLPFQKIDHQPPIPVWEKGHFQADTVIGKSTDSLALATTIDVNTGKVRIKLYNRKATSFAKVISKSVSKNFQSLRIDNGSENSKLHYYLPKEKIFTCHPYSSWEKGVIENMHRLIRMVWPKSKSMNLLTPEAVMVIEQFVNSYYRPRYQN